MTAEPLQPILEVRNITKRFPGVLALDDVSVKFVPGEVHAIVGENGAGKSTLMKIMAGAYQPDSGEMLFQGKPVSFAHPKAAQEAGISIIYQEFNLLPERTVAQNVFFGREPHRFGLIDQRDLTNKTYALLKEIGAADLIQPQRLVRTLPIAQQQTVEIAKALAVDSKVLIMDEPTAALSMNEVKVLYDLVGRLLARGMAILFISHRLVEVFDIANQITVLKDGQKVDTVAVSDTSPDHLVEMMVGRKLDHYFPGLAQPGDIGELRLRVSNASNAKLSNINLELRTGEILGIAGLQGSGRTELAQAIFGVDPFLTGTMEVKGRFVEMRSPAVAIKQGMGYVTEDRKLEGIFPNQPLRDNILITLRALKSLLLRVLPNGVREKPDLVPELASRVDVRAPSYQHQVQYLSGGNQQKVVLGKWLASTADIFIFDEPTRGIDVEAKASIHDMVRELARQGAAIMMISSELPEIIGMSDRIVVMWDGAIAGELPARSTEAQIMLLATGHGNSNGDKQQPQSAAPVSAS